MHAIASRCKHCKASLGTAPAVSTHAPQASTGWAVRWPAIAIGVALVAIGLSLGMLVERWRSAREQPAPDTRPRSVTPRAVPDRMPAPVVPEPKSTP